MFCVRLEQGRELQVQQPLSEQCLPQERPQQVPAGKSSARRSSRQFLLGKCALKHHLQEAAQPLWQYGTMLTLNQMAIQLLA